MKRFAIVLPALLCGASLCAAAVPAPSLPEFNGWQRGADSVILRAPWGLPRDRTAPMREDGLQQVEKATFQRDGRTLTVTGLRFQDATGAFGAFTLLCPSDAAPFDAGLNDAEAVSSGDQVLMARGSWVLEVRLDAITAMTASDMRALLAALPMRGGPLDQPPTIQLYLPAAHELSDSMRYAEGPAAFAAACDWVPAAAIGFNMGAEAALAAYALPDGLPDVPPAQLLVIGYPTPQIARTRLASLSRLPQAGTFLIRRSGPILVLLHGAGSADAQQLLQSVNYDAEVTMTQPTPIGIEGLPGLIIAIFLLIALIVAVAVGVGLITGFLPAALRRLFPRRFRPPSADQEIIMLHLSDPSRRRE